MTNKLQKQAEFLSEKMKSAEATVDDLIEKLEGIEKESKSLVENAEEVDPSLKEIFFGNIEAAQNNSNAVANSIRDAHVAASKQSVLSGIVGLGPGDKDDGR